ncbi:pirin family protein [Orrella marina]|uniref:Quercetin 2,3-dioxygenase n=1 Tax=Orrella marina TaxID=2163011 RepID=A0A2R4XI36_9BURK|nr:pirin family protein [Orrella marina]AWB33482.1 quercetin 2,3-dioxygenase [Orrella marina]
MFSIRRSNDRGYADHGWLKSFHTFSFAGYYDPEHTGWGNLRVINEDRIAPGTGFGTHGHRDMEIVSYVISGELAHSDSMGNGASIKPGEVQRMSAGTGVRHSEFNHADGQTTHFLQIWIEPDQAGIEPGYEQKSFSDEEKRGRLRLLASPDGRDGSVTIHADALLYGSLLDETDEVSVELDSSRRYYLHVVQGRVAVNGQALESGDAARLADESELVLNDAVKAEVLLFDLSNHPQQ